jgi:hypothetical protein
MFKLPDEEKSSVNEYAWSALAGAATEKPAISIATTIYVEILFIAPIVYHENFILSK